MATKSRKSAPGRRGGEQRISDRNGSKVEIRGNQIVDDMGRTITLNGEGVTTQGVDGQEITTGIVWNSRWVNRQYKAIPASETNVPEFAEHWATVNEEVPAVSEIVLPVQAGGQSYLFDYYGATLPQYGTNYTEGWGELKSVTLPTGAKTTYTYQFAPGTDAEASEILDNRTTSKELVYNETYDTVQTQRTEKTLFDSGPIGAYVVAPSGAVSGEVFLNYYANPSKWDNGLSYRSFGPDSSFVEKIWNHNIPIFAGHPANTEPNVDWGNGNAYVKTEFFTDADASGQPYLTAIKDYAYDKNGNVTRISEYDWVPHASIPRQAGRPTGIPSGAPLKRVTVNEYYNQAPDAESSSSSPYTYENPSSLLLKNVLRSTEVSDSGNIAKTRSEFFYDDPDTKGNLIETRSLGLGKRRAAVDPRFQRQLPEFLKFHIHLYAVQSLRGARF